MPYAQPPEHSKFKKGQSGNPNGRPKGVPNTKTRLLRMLTLIEKQKNPVTGEIEDFTVAEILDLQQIIKARQGDTRAYNSLIDRLEGRAEQNIISEISVSPVREILNAFGLDDPEKDDDVREDNDSFQTPPESKA